MTVFVCLFVCLFFILLIFYTLEIANIVACMGSEFSCSFTVYNFIIGPVYLIVKTFTIV